LITNLRRCQSGAGLAKSERYYLSACTDVYTFKGILKS
jgi:hypothetical protein